MGAQGGSGAGREKSSTPPPPGQDGPGQATWVQPDTSLDHVTALARQLVRHLGEQGARKTCQDNHWNGVLNAIDTIR